MSRIAILGAGSLGTVFGAWLQQAGHDVLMICRRKEQARTLSACGVVLDGSDSAAPAIRLPAATDCAPLPEPDYVIVLVKSFGTREALSRILPWLGTRSRVLSLQNGIGNEDVLCEALGRDRVLAGITYVGGLLQSNNRLLASVDTRRTVIGAVDDSARPAATALCDIFNAAGLACLVSQTIDSVLWNKLMVNVATGAVSAISGLAYGELYRCADLEALAISAVAEGMQVAAAAGIALDFTDPAEPWRRAADGMAPDFKASMLQSIENGTMTEVDYINGAIVRTGLQFKIDTPVNATLTRCVHGIEHRITRRP